MDGNREDEPVSAKQNAKEAAVCEECKENPSKYKCPGCSIRSCSLPCVKAHKLRTGCTGKRDVTQFVPLSQFNDNLILSDYQMLEEVKRVAESAQRTRGKLCGYYRSKLPFGLKNLRTAASRRKIKLLFLPSGMSRREKNQTKYDERTKMISWTIEWRFHSTNVVLIDHGVCEDASIYSVIENHLKPGPWNHQLKQFCDVQLDSLKFFIRKCPKGPRLHFLELDIKAPLRKQLAKIIILEYPSIHVFLPSHRYDFEIVRDAHLVGSKPALEDSSNNGQQCPQGVTFKEEEIEEGTGSCESLVIDLMKQVNASPVCQFHHENEFEKAVKNSSDRSILPRVASCSTSDSGLKANGPEVTEEMEFDFDQDLIDTYSELAAINTDDFLVFEGEFSKEMEVEGDDFSNFRGTFSEAVELEEGEIAD
ncbi:box C/D snoRNA protein 1 [Carica papaya]|uniref:box C/D snoRNA protein 1 n=1 Tax=Carica papaya TaxID=3649 RepID=UPI000B8C80F7|nr:box C/D snoRNA protein 1 [Carica papaya]